MSLGGMIGQFMAVRHPDRVRSLTSMSSSPSLRWWVCRPRVRTLFKLVALSRRVGTTREDSGDYYVNLFRITGSTGYPLDEQSVREFGRRCYDEGVDGAAFSRALAAIRSAGDRRAELATVRAPTLVLHGEADPMQSVRAGKATADAIPHARMVSYPGMGHDFPRELWPAIIDEVCAVTALADANG
jgi:pimeloyl-ACP methyl ester carboxylesterase